MRILLFKGMVEKTPQERMGVQNGECFPFPVSLKTRRRTGSMYKVLEKRSGRVIKSSKSPHQFMPCSPSLRKKAPWGEARSISRFKRDFYEHFQTCSRFSLYYTSVLYIFRADKRGFFSPLDVTPQIERFPISKSSYSDRWGHFSGGAQLDKSFPLPHCRARAAQN